MKRMSEKYSWIRHLMENGLGDKIDGIEALEEHIERLQDSVKAEIEALKKYVRNNWTREEIGFAKIIDKQEKERAQ